MTKRSTFRRLGRNKVWPDWYRRLLVEAEHADERAARMRRQGKSPSRAPRLTMVGHRAIGVITVDSGTRV